MTYLLGRSVATVAAQATLSAIAESPINPEDRTPEDDSTPTFTDTNDLPVEAKTAALEGEPGKPETMIGVTSGTVHRCMDPLTIADDAVQHHTLAIRDDAVQQNTTATHTNKIALHLRQSHNLQHQYKLPDQKDTDPH